MASNGFKSLKIAAKRFEPHGALWSLMEPHGALWSPMEPMEPYGALVSKFLGCDVFH